MSLPEKPDFIAVFDADFVAKPAFAARTLALMADPGVAIVQTPQYFYNPDPFQYVLRAAHVWPDEQRNWFDARLPCLDGAGGATCCGTSCLIRVAPLVDVGGFPTESVSEDTLLSIKFYHRGIRTRYLDEVLSVGLAPEGIHEFLTQRIRWCLGSLEIAMNREWGPRKNPRLAGYLQYLEGTYRWAWHSFVKVAWMLIPPAYFFFGFTVLEADLLEFVGYFAPIMVARFGMTWMNRNTFMPIAADAPALLMAPFVIATTRRAVRGGSHGAFKVTDKGKSRRRTVFHARPAALPLTLLLLTASSVVYAFLDRYSMLHAVGSHELVLFWAFVNMLVLLATLAPCIEPPRYRSAERYPCDLVVNARLPQLARVRLSDISEQGVRVQLGDSPVDGRLALELPGIGWVDGRIRRRAEGTSYGVELALTEHRKAELIRWVYASETFIRPVSQWSFWGSVGSVLRYAFGR
jgi:cellulose synthase (UDP-forming)